MQSANAALNVTPEIRRAARVAIERGKSERHDVTVIYRTDVVSVPLSLHIHASSYADHLGIRSEASPLSKVSLLVIPSSFLQRRTLLSLAVSVLKRTLISIRHPCRKDHFWVVWLRRYCSAVVIEAFRRSTKVTRILPFSWSVTYAHVPRVSVD